MMPAALSRRAQELAARGEAFVTATVVHAQRPTSAKPGMAALVLADGAIEGFVGGSCTEHSVRAYSLLAMESGEAVLLKILPFAGAAGADVVAEDGTVTVQNPCLSGGAIEVFLEPVLPAPRVLVVGDTPIASAVLRIGAELELDAVAVDGTELEPRAGDRQRGHRCPARDARRRAHRHAVHARARVGGDAGAAGAAAVRLA